MTWNDLTIQRLASDNTSLETIKNIKKMCTDDNGMESNFFNQISKFVRAGNREIALEMIKECQKYPNFGCNQLHM